MEFQVAGVLGILGAGAGPNLMDDRAYLEDFLRYLRVERQMSPHTLRSYRLDISQFLEFYRSRPGNPDLQEVAYPDLRAFLAQALKGRRKATVARKLSALRTFCKYLQRQGVLAGNPARLAPSPKLEKPLPHFLTVDEAFHLLGACGGDAFGACRDRAILEVFYGGGLRLSELAGLDLGDLDLDQGVLRVWGKGGQGEAGLSGEAGPGGAGRLSGPAPGPAGQNGWDRAGGCSPVPQPAGRPPQLPFGGPPGGQVGAAGGPLPGPDPPRPAPQLRHPPAGGPGRLAHRPGAAGARLHLQHPAVFAYGPRLLDGGIRQGASPE